MRESVQLNAKNTLFKQPLLGGISLVFVIVMCLLIITSFSAEIFASWVSFLFMCCVPTQIICGLVWSCQYPEKVACLRQPYKGLVYLSISIVGGLLLAITILFVVAQGAMPPGPQHNIFIILFITNMFWLVGILQCQPFITFFKKPFLLALMILISAFVITYILFFFVINFEFIANSPIYLAQLDGGGPVMAFDFLTFAVTTVAAIMVLIVIDFKPIAKLPGADKTPLFILWSVVVVLLLSTLVKTTFVVVLGFDQIVYMVMVPISFIFGAFILLNLYEKSLLTFFSEAYQTYISLVICLIFTVIIYQLFMVLGPLVSGDMLSGSPSYELNFWVANAMLSICFPLIVLHTDFLQHWPFRSDNSRIS
ncbi:MAG: hypothetical protein HRT51_17415 [Colwellia sp.]|nr:hypothetical protein [Colwellia sp.]